MRNTGNFKADGFLMVENIYSQAEMISLSKSIGSIIPHPNGKSIVALTSSNGEKSLTGTLSNIYGLSEFPLHTDTAFWGVPARYVVMGMVSTSECTTNYISLQEIDEFMSGELFNKARRAIYLIETFEGSKYTSPVFYMAGSYGFRFDPNIMTPVNSHAKKFHKELSAALEKIEVRKVEWSGNKAIVFDNWKYLHGRSAVKNENREIFRIYLED